MAKKKRGPQSQLAAGMYALNQRRVYVWIPFLKDRVAALQAQGEQKQEAGNQGQRVS